MLMANESHTRACLRSFVCERVSVDRVVPATSVPGVVARTGRIDLCTQGDVCKTLGSQRTKHQDTAHELYQVTSPGARKLRTLCRQNDAAIGSAVRGAAQSD